ncbi:hypothetical protein Goe27_01940 [Bacillus phage vB_BsuM-Goe27]|nr:hypothetical protein Goe27_01940 [Bacillus phage vB_BsuM-Goe27]
MDPELKEFAENILNNTWSDQDREMLRFISTEPVEAKKELRSHWVTGTFKGEPFEGVLMYIEWGKGVVFCTDGEVRTVDREDCEEDDQA